MRLSSDIVKSKDSTERPLHVAFVGRLFLIEAPSAFCASTDKNLTLRVRGNFHFSFSTGLQSIQEILCRLRSLIS